jgi:hypothetical protein
MAALLALLVFSAAASFTSVGMSRSLSPRPLLQSGNGSNIPAGGDVWPVAIFWVFIQIGTPPQDFPVAIDSGSGDLDVSGKGCKGCVTTAPNRAYDPLASSSSQPVSPYSFSNSYQTCDLSDPVAVCTISGKLYSDKVSMAGLGPVSVDLGSILSQTSNFDQFKVIDGVMGFTGGGTKSVFGQLVKGQKCDDVWAICIHEGAKSNGTLTIGGADPQLSGPVTYVPDVGAGFHAVKVASFTVGNTSIPLSGASGILDTGTNILLVPKTTRTALHKNMCANTSLVNCDALWTGKCVDLTDDQVNSYPELALVLSGSLSLRMSSRDYLLRGSPLAKAPTNYCLGIGDGGSAGGSGFIIGDTTMRNYYLVFDQARRMIGWGDVNRDTCGNL